MIVVVLSYSIYKIRKFCKMLVQNNVFANEFLMLAHLGFFTFLALTFVATGTLTILLNNEDQISPTDLKVKRQIYAL